MNFTMVPLEIAGVHMVKLGEGLVFPLDSLPQDLKTRWRIALKHIEKGDDVSGALKAMTREAVEALWPQIMMRAVHSAPRSTPFGQDAARE
jgi:hypothetical protein